jgi:hypothetical protein
LLKCSYYNISSAINFWCSAWTIRKWIQSREGFHLYNERIIPLISQTQKQKHFDFASHFRNNWGLNSRRYLLIHYDEKWFWGMLLRKNAKSFDDLPVAVQKAYHKLHISKVMCVAVVGFAFRDTIENGGEAVKLAFTRCQSYKVSGKTVRESRRDENGNLKFDGPIKRAKDDLYLVDCAVTGSNSGTADNPKFPLTRYFDNVIFPQIKDLVGMGGRYEGYTVIIQGDNAGPHQESDFMTHVTEYCNREGWHWEPQAPQMPHMNVLDLSVFPNMSRRHAKLAREHHGPHMLTEDEIWTTAEKVWRDLEHSKIASGFIQAHRIASKVIDAAGDNSFLASAAGGIHANVRTDFYETSTGMKRKDGILQERGV